jgi:hypothetical protein
MGFGHQKSKMIRRQRALWIAQADAIQRTGAEAATSWNQDIHGITCVDSELPPTSYLLPPTPSMVRYACVERFGQPCEADYICNAAKLTKIAQRLGPSSP